MSLEIAAVNHFLDWLAAHGEDFALTVQAYRPAALSGDGVIPGYEYCRPALPHERKALLERYQRHTGLNVLPDLDSDRRIDVPWELAIYAVIEDGRRLGSISHRRNPDGWFAVREGDDTGEWVATKEQAVRLLSEVPV